MAEQSIFHGVVKGETSYTQLLRNLLERDENFRHAFLAIIGLNETSANLANIRSEVHLGDHGRADLLINTDEACAIIEIKIALDRGCEKTQILSAEKEDGYASYLRAEARKGYKTFFFFLIPAASYFAADIRGMVKEHREAFDREGITTGVILWEHIVDKLRGLAPLIGSSYLADFQMLLEEKFGPVILKDWEVKMLFSSSFPIKTFIAYVKFIEDLRSQLGDKAFVLQIEKDEFGFASKKGNFWCGFWGKYWNEYPYLLFGVVETSDAVKNAFAVSLKEEFGQPVISIRDTHEWLCGYLPLESLVGIDGFEMNKQKLQSIWKALSAAGI